MFAYSIPDGPGEGRIHWKCYGDDVIRINSLMKLKPGQSIAVGAVLRYNDHEKWDDLTVCEGLTA